MSERRPTEKVVETAILKWLAFLPDCFAWKNNTIGVYDEKRACYRRSNNPYDINGVSDILGIYKGRMLAIEVKRDKSCKPSKEQRDFIAMIIKHGGIAGVAYSIETAKELLDEG